MSSEFAIVAERERWMLRVQITSGELYGIHVHFDSNSQCLQ